MFRIDNSVKDEYWSQINNKRFPFSACNVTSGIMFMRSNRIPYLNPTTEADDDYFMWRMRQPDAYAKMEELAPWSVRDRTYQVTDWTSQAQIDRRYLFPPSEVWVCLAWGINALAGASVCRLRFDLRLLEFLFELVRGRTMIVGGKYTASGHFVDAVGLITGQDRILDAKVPTDIEQPQVSHVIVDDPYGNYLTGYQDHRGNSVEIPIETYLDVAAAFRHRSYGPPKHVLYAIVKTTA